MKTCSCFDVVVVIFLMEGETSGSPALDNGRQDNPDDFAYDNVSKRVC